MSWDTEPREGIAKRLIARLSDPEAEPVEIENAGGTSDGETLWSLEGLFTAADLLAIGTALAEYERPGLSAMEHAEACRGAEIEEDDDAR